MWINCLYKCFSGKLDVQLPAADRAIPLPHGAIYPVKLLFPRMWEGRRIIPPGYMDRVGCFCVSLGWEGRCLPSYMKLTIQ